jgi:hypothetical protein
MCGAWGGAAETTMRSGPGMRVPWTSAYIVVRGLRRPSLPSVKMCCATTLSREQSRERPSSLIVAGRVRTHAVVSALIDNCHPAGTWP